MSSEARQLRAIDEDVPPRRIPKLTYRNHHIGESTVTTSNDQIISYQPSHENEQSISSSVTSEQALSTLDTAEPLHSSKASVSTTIRETQAIVPRRSSASASVNQSEAPAIVDDVKRRKYNSFLGFLSLKEPSTSALEDFARQQQKQAAAKVGQTTAVGMPGISTQRLPPTVPKVNSKWDGLPSPMKDRAKDIRSSTKDQTIKMASRASESSSSSSGMSSQASRRSSSSVRFSTPVAQPKINSEHPSVPGPGHQDEEDLTTSFRWTSQTQRHQEGIQQFQNDSCSGRRRSDSVAEPLASSGSSSHHGEQHVRSSPDIRQTATGIENEEGKDPEQNGTEQEGIGPQCSFNSVKKTQDMATHVTVSPEGWSENKGRVSVEDIECSLWDEQNLPIPPCLLPPPRKDEKKLVSSLLAGTAAEATIR